jgi:hypothetical protein
MRNPTREICEAITARRQLIFEYDGITRIAQPYCHGWNKSGEVVRALQIGGASRSGGFWFGKLWIVTKMTGLRVSEAGFEPNDPNYNPDDSAMTEIHCCI